MIGSSDFEPLAVPAHLCLLAEEAARRADFEESRTAWEGLARGGVHVPEGE